MTKKLLPLLGVFLALLFTSSAAFAAPAVWESYTANNDTNVELYGAIWSAQTFTTGTEAHSVTEIRILCYKEGNPGTITASIKAVDGSDHPTGADLCSGTANADYFTTGTGGAWYSVDVDDYSLEESTMYALVVRVVAGDASNSLHWNMDGSSAAYADGQEEVSTNSGVSWTGDSDDDYMFEIWGDNLIDIGRAEVYNGYLEDNDTLIVCEYTNTYVPYYPDYDCKRYFDLQLRSADGATLLAQATCQAWDDRPGSIYLSADASASLTIGTAYRVYLYGDFGSNPETYYTLQSADWRGTDFTYLDSWVMLTAHRMESYYGIDLTEYLASGEALSTEGGVLFINGIPLLEQVRPDLFSEIIYVPGYIPGTGTEGWSGTSWETQVGTSGAAGINAVATLFGMTGQRLGGMLIIAGYIGLACFLLPRGHSIAGMIAGAPLIFLGMYLRLIDAVFIGVMLSILVVFIVYHFWVRNTA